MDWISMNYIAEQLQTLKQYEAAKIIAENNAKAFPNRDLIMVTMGKIYLALDRKQDAIVYYKKALEIYPGYEEAKKQAKATPGKSLLIKGKYDDRLSHRPDNKQVLPKQKGLECDLRFLNL